MKTIAETGLTTKNSSPLLIELTSLYKYGGLIKRKKYHYIRNLIFSLMIHLDSISKPLFSLQSVSLVIRTIYYILPSFFIANSEIWKNGSNEKKLLDSISIFFYLSHTENVSNIITKNIIIVFSFLLLFSAYGFSAHKYNESSKISAHLPSTFEIMNFFVYHVLLNYAGSEIGYVIGLIITDRNNDIWCTITTILVGICSISAIWFYSIFLSNSLVFRPISMITILGKPQSMFLLLSLLINFCSSVSSHLKNMFQISIIVVVILLYILSMRIPYMLGSLIMDSDKELFISISFAGLINTGLVLCLTILGKTINEYVLVLFCFTIMSSYIVSRIIVKNKNNNAMVLLDIWLEGIEKIEDNYDYSKIINTSVIGMSYCHPMCINWSIFQTIIDLWPDKKEGWIVFAKFLAIYPEESSMLSYLAQQMLKTCTNIKFSKQISMQMLSLIQQRESNLSSVLKRKIEDVKKSINHSKRSLRVVWDQVIQGNIDEMDSSIQSSYNSVTNSSTDINHLHCDFPNNKFVLRLCIQYYSEILADYAGREKYVEKLSQLKRGNCMAEDYAHQFGIIFFPNLPKKLNQQKSYMVDNTESMINQENEFEDTTNDAESKMLTVIKDRIDNMEFSSINCSNSVLIFILLCILVSISITIAYVFPFISNISKPISIIYHLSLLRTLNFQIPSFIHHMVFEEVPKNAPFFDKVNLNGVVPTAFGSTTDTRKQVLYLAKMVYFTIENLLKYRLIGSEDKNYEQIQTLVFGNNIRYTHYLGFNNPIPQNTSYQLIMTDYAFQATKAAEMNEFTDEMFNNSIHLNPGLNGAPVAESMSSTLIKLFETLEVSINSLLEIVSNISIIVPSCLIVGLILISTYSIKNIKKNQRRIFQSLMSIPKNIVSSLSDNLKMIRKEKSDTSKKTDTDKDHSKQEDHILKIFSSVSDSSSSFGYSLVFIVCVIILAICIIVASVFLFSLYRTICTLLLRNTPHLDHILGTSGYIVGMFSAFNNAVATFMGYPNLNSPANLAGRAIFRIDTFRSHYSVVRFGNSTRNIPPFPNFESEIKKVDLRRGCSQNDDLNISNMRERIKCYPPTLQILLVETWMQHMIHGFLSGEYKTFDTHSELFNELWYMVIFNLYEFFLYPMFDTILPTIDTTITSSMASSLLPVGLCSILFFVLIIGICLYNQFMKKKFKYVLSLLLHCPIETLMHTPRIVNILANDQTDIEYSKRDSEYYDQIVSNLPDLIIICNNQFKIVSLNRSASAFFLDKHSIDQDIKEFFSQNIFTQKIPFSENSNTLVLPDMIMVTNNGSQNYFKTNTIILNQYYVICMKNETQIVVYNQLIENEKQKSDMMLNSILPPVFVKSLQAGQKNAGFLVQNASVLFIDIVGFTPWCASLSANQVMTTLNLIFRELDSLLPLYPTMIKVKCIGDCYMAAGGIFVDGNNPTVHAKEAVQFGLSAIEAIHRINNENKIDIKIRIGVHTGGPIVVGVIGTKKPTFEILGPLISMAQQMEHHGVPMNVHISRSVYELIFSGNFNIKEHGEQMIKDKKILTYLVS